MNKEYFLTLAKYNFWANETVCTWLSNISEEQWNQEINSSFNSIRETTIHILSAEFIWMERLLQVENTTWIATDYKKSKAATIDDWLSTSAKLIDILDVLENDKLNDTITFKRLNGDINSNEVWKMLSHVFNHSTYHRGQLVTMLRQVDFKGITSTDLLAYYNKK